jgi:hypothetical protein
MPVDLKRVQSVFLAAIEESDLARRADVVDRECGVDLALRQRVEALLRAHDLPESDLDQPVIPDMPTAALERIRAGGESAFGVVAGPTDSTSGAASSVG